MNTGRPRGISARITEAVASAWVLLSATDAYLARTSVFAQYEGELKRLRAALSAAAHDNDAQADIRRAIVRLRKNLRLQGHDLSLGSLDLALRGFRSDSALAEGFTRAVAMLGAGRVLAVAGQDNHVEIFARAEAETARRGWDSPGGPHSLWFRWTRNLLELSGADSEPKEAFEEFTAYCGKPENRLRILEAFKRLR